MRTQRGGPESLIKLSRAQAGLTLVELLVVVSIISSVAFMSLSVLDGNSNQLRFEQTRHKWLQIRRALIGDDSRTVSGEPDIYGYIHDMGSLPDTIQALLIAPADCDGDGIDGNGDGDKTNDTCPWRYDSELKRWLGWRGPYLPAVSSAGSPGEFRDGWGNGDVGDANFGWQLSLKDDDFFVSSFGLSGVAGVRASLETPDHADKAIAAYERDYPQNILGQPLANISASEYGVYLSEGIIVSPFDKDDEAAKGSQGIEITFKDIPDKAGVEPEVCLMLGKPVQGHLQWIPARYSHGLLDSVKVSNVFNLVSGEGRHPFKFYFPAPDPELITAYQRPRIFEMGELTIKLGIYTAATGVDTAKCESDDIFKAQRDSQAQLKIYPQRSVVHKFTWNTGGLSAANN